MMEILFAFDPAILMTFVLAGLLLNITPGADFLLVTTSAINSGPGVGRAAGAGITLGILVHISLAVAGVSALLASPPLAYDAIRYLGAFYLLVIAYRAWTDRGDLAETRPANAQLTAFRRGFLTNILNPKTALFILAFIPQFTDPAIGPIWKQILILGLIFAVNGLIFDLILGTLAGRLAPLLRRYLKTLNKLTAMLFGALAARLALA